MQESFKSFQKFEGADLSDVQALVQKAREEHNPSKRRVFLMFAAVSVRPGPQFVNTETRTRVQLAEEMPPPYVFSTEQVQHLGKLE